MRGGSKSHLAGWQLRARAFTLPELLVVAGVIAVLAGLLFPAMRSARQSAQKVNCASNMRQLTQALLSYAGQNRGLFPPNSAQIGQFWYLESTIGSHITAPDRVERAGLLPAGGDPNLGLAGGVFVCPDDLEDSVRSYSMNLYASGGVSEAVRKRLDSDAPPGRLFGAAVAGKGSELLLLLETWPELPVKGTNPPRHVAQAVAGLVGKPGQRFGGGTGIVWTDPPDATPGRFDVRASQITFYRHAKGHKAVEDPRGKANFAFIDGHVALLDQRELVQQGGKSSLVALWSSIDREIEESP